MTSATAYWLCFTENDTRAPYIDYLRYFRTYGIFLRVDRSARRPWISASCISRFLALVYAMARQILTLNQLRLSSWDLYFFCLIKKVWVTCHLDTTRFYTWFRRLGPHPQLWLQLLGRSASHPGNTRLGSIIYSIQGNTNKAQLQIIRLPREPGKVQKSLPDFYVDEYNICSHKWQSVK